MRRQTFAIIGLGLLGGSLAGALRKQFRNARVIGISRSASKLREAKRKKLITDGARDLRNGVQSADFIIICTPVDTIPKLIAEVDRFAKRSAIVTDVGSTKETLIRWAAKRKFKNIRFIGSHPMAGSHLTGLSHASSDLYRDSLTFVTKHAGAHKGSLKSVVSFWRKLCRKVVVLPAERHDKIVSEISHLPHVVAALLAQSASTTSLPFASSGFRDTTRIARSDARLWVPILLSNRRNLLRKLGEFSRTLNQIKSSLSRSNQKQLTSFLKSASNKLS